MGFSLRHLLDDVIHPGQVPQQNQNNRPAPAQLPQPNTNVSRVNNTQGQPSLADRLHSALNFTGRNINSALVAPVANTFTGDIVDPAKQIVAQVTHNPVAQANAEAAALKAQAASLPQLILKPFINTANEARYVPAAINREIHNQPIDDINQKAFGTTNPVNIGKEIAGNTLAEELTVGAPGFGKIATDTAAPVLDSLANPVVNKLATGLVRGTAEAPVGAAFNVASLEGSDPTASGNEIKSAALQGGIFGGLAGAAPDVVPAAREGVMTGVPKLIQYGKDLQAKDAAKGEAGFIGAPPSQPPITAQHMTQAQVIADNAQTNHAPFQAKMTGVAKDLGLDYKAGPPKTAERIAQKVVNEENGNFGNLKDTVRGTMTIPDPSNFQHVVDAVGKHYPVTRIKNGFENGIASGYKDIKLNVKHPDGSIGEVILSTPEMLKAKHELGGHTLYKEARTTVDATQLEALNQKMQKLYAAADSATTKRLTSAADTSLPSTKALAGGKGAPLETTKPLTDLPSDSKRTTVSPTSKNLVPGDVSGADIPRTIKDNSNFVKPGVDRTKLSGRALDTPSAILNNSTPLIERARKAKQKNKDLIDSIESNRPKPKVVENKLTTGGKEGRQNLSPEAQAGISGEHAVRSTAKLDAKSVAKADSLSTDDLISKTHEALAVEPGKIDDNTVALANKAIERADSAGRLEDAVGIHDALSEHLVKNGQTIQAASLLYRLSPKGMLYKALKDLKKGGTDVTPELKGQLNDLADKIKNSKGEAKNRAKAEFSKKVADNLPKGKLNTAIAVWKAGLLSGFKTHGGNFVSNATFSALKDLSNPVAAAVDKAISFKTGERTKTSTLRGRISGAGEGARKGFDTLTSGIDSRNDVNSKYETHGELNFKNSIVQKVIGTPTNFVFRAMSAGDQPFYFSTVKQNLYDQAKAAGLNLGLKGQALKDHVDNLVANPSEKMAETAKEAGKVAVLGQDSKFASSISRVASQHPSVSILAPFIKVPTNFLTRTLDFTPVGAIKTAAKQIKAGSLDQRALSEAIGEATTGTALVYLGAELAKHSMLSGQYPSDPKEQQRWKAEGITPNSVKVGNKWISLNYAGPAGLLLGAGKDFIEAAARGDNGAVASLAGFGKSLTGQSFLTGFSGFANAINDPQRSAKTFINSEAGSIVPSLSNDIANAFDKSQREVNTVGDSIKSRLPGARNTLPVKEDVYGNKLKQRTNSIDLTIDPLRPSNTMGDSVVKEVARLHGADPNNKDLQVTPVPINKKFTINSGKDQVSISLNNKQRHDLQEQVGQATDKAWGNLIKTSEYKAMSDSDKANALNKLRQDVTAVSTRQFVVDNNLGSYVKPLTGSQMDLAAGNTDVPSYAKTKDSSGSDAYSLAQFKKSPDKTRQIGDKTYFKTKDGTVSSKSTFNYNADIQSSKLAFTLDRAKATDDYASWKTAASNKLNLLQEQMGQYDPQTEADKISAIQKQAADLVDQANTYASYGGFTKPKTGSGSSRSTNGITYKPFNPTSLEKSLKSLIDNAKVAKVK